jgi:ParB/RepB/Spo0J family partition protein
VAKNRNKSSDTEPQRKIVKRRLSQLRPHPRQRVTFTEHSAAEIQELADDIDANGLNNPVEITPNNTIIAGHGRLAAVKLLGRKEIDCWLRDDLTDEEADRRHIMDNKNRRHLTPLGQARVYRAEKELDNDVLRNGEGGDLRDIIGRKLRASGRKLDRLVKILDTPIEIQHAYELGLLTQKQALAVAALPDDQQEQIATRIRNGDTPRDVVKQVVPNKPQVTNVGRELDELGKALQVAQQKISPNMRRVSVLHREYLPVLRSALLFIPRAIKQIETNDAPIRRIKQIGEKLKRRR